MINIYSWNFHLCIIHRRGYPPMLKWWKIPNGPFSWRNQTLGSSQKLKVYYDVISLWNFASGLTHGTERCGTWYQLARLHPYMGIMLTAHPPYPRPSRSIVNQWETMIMQCACPSVKQHKCYSTQAAKLKEYHCTYVCIVIAFALLHLTRSPLVIW